MRSGRRAVRRIAAAGALTCTVLSVALPAIGQEDAVPPPDIWRGAAVAEVVTFEVDRDGLLPVADVLRFGVVTGESAYETDRQTARASLLYPGEGLIQGLNLACGTFGGLFPPELAPVIEACLSYDYPLTVRADASQADASTEGRVQLGRPTDAVSALALGANAHAAADGASTHAALEDLRVLGLPAIDVIPLLPVEQLRLDPSVVVVGSATSRTDQRFEGGRLVVEASSVLSGVRILGGLVDIGAIRSTSRVTDDAAGVRTADAVLEVTGVTVAGVPAQVTADGLVLGTPTGVLGPIQQQLANVLQQLVQALGLRISVLDVEETTDDGTGQARASASGLLVEIGLNVGGLPAIPGPLGDIDLNGAYVGSIQLGHTGAAGAADQFPVDDVPSSDGDSIDLPPALGGGIPSGGALPDVGEGTGAPAPTTSPSSPERRAAASSDPFDGRLELLYAAFALAVLALCLSAPLTLPARLPGPRP